MKKTKKEEPFYTDYKKLEEKDWKKHGIYESISMGLFGGALLTALTTSMIHGLSAVASISSLIATGAALLIADSAAARAWGYSTRAQLNYERYFRQRESRNRDNSVEKRKETRRYIAYQKAELEKLKPTPGKEPSERDLDKIESIKRSVLTNSQMLRESSPERLEKAAELRRKHKIYWDAKRAINQRC